MVLGDHDSGPDLRDTKIDGRGFRHASPLDRLAAFVIDVAVLGLFSTLIFAPFQRVIQSARVTENVDQYLWAGVWGALSVVLFGVVYHTLFVYFKGGTPGKLAFRLRVVNIWTQKNPGFGEALLRALVWWMDALTLLPNAGVYTDSQRRPLHDRISDSVVVALGRNTVGAPSAREMWIMRKTVLMAYALVAIAVASGVYEEMRSDSGDGEPGTLLSNGPRGCEEVIDHFETWETRRRDQETRLSVALALFAVGDISEECLNQETSEAFRSSEDLELAYLARAFVTSDSADLSDEYLAKTCFQDQEGEPCQFAKLVELWTEKKWDEASQGFDKLLPKSRDYVRVWAVKHFERTKDFARELKIIEDLWPHQKLATFLGSHRVVALWGLHRIQEARVAMTSVLESLDSDKGMGLASWGCMKEMEEGCHSELPNACRLFDRGVKDSPDVLENELVSMTFVKTRECLDGTKVNYHELELQVHHEGTQKLLRALARVQTKNSLDSESRKILEELGNAKEDQEILATEARHRLIELAAGAADLQVLDKQWVQADRQSWGWRGLGAHLFQKYRFFGSHRSAIEVGRVLLMHDPSDQKVEKEMVLAAYRLGDLKVAWEILRQRTNSRAPASAADREFEEVSRSLEQRFGGP